MSPLRRFIPPVLLVVVYGIVVTGFFYTSFAYELFALATLVVFGTLASQIKESVFSREFWNFLISPMIFFLSGLFFVLFLSNPILRDVLFIAVLFFVSLYVHQLSLLFYEPSKYQPFALESVSSYLNLISIFFTAVVLYGFLVFMSTPLWLLTILLVAVVSLVTYQAFWIHKIDHQAHLVYTVVLSIVLVELFWALSFLPIQFFVHGALIAVSYYVLWGMVRAHVANTLARPIIVRYLLIGSVLAALIIATAPWT